MVVVSFLCFKEEREPYYAEVPLVVDPVDSRLVPDFDRIVMVGGPRPKFVGPLWFNCMRRAIRWHLISGL